MSHHLKKYIGGFGEISLCTVVSREIMEWGAEYLRDPKPPGLGLKATYICKWHRSMQHKWCFTNPKGKIAPLDFWSELNSISILNKLYPRTKLIVRMVGLVLRGYKIGLLLENYDLGSLGNILKNKIPYNITQVKLWCDDLFKILIFLQKAEMIHRDIKPENLCLRRKNGTVFTSLVLIDFNSTTCDNKEHPHWLTGTSVITVGYRAPEVFAGSRTYSISVDRWAATCVMAEILMGKPTLLNPFRRKFNMKKTMISSLGVPYPHKQTNLSAEEKLIFGFFVLNSQPTRLSNTQPPIVIHIKNNIQTQIEATTQDVKKAIIFFEQSFKWFPDSRIQDIQQSEWRLQCSQQKMHISSSENSQRTLARSSWRQTGHAEGMVHRLPKRVKRRHTQGQRR